VSVAFAVHSIFAAETLIRFDAFFFFLFFFFFFFLLFFVRLCEEKGLAKRKTSITHSRDKTENCTETEMAPKTFPKWVEKAFEFTRENTATGQRDPLTLCEALLKQHYAAFLEAQPLPKEKAPSDPLAASVASTLKKLATATPEEQTERLASIEALLGAKFAQGGSGVVPDADISSRVMQAVAKGVGLEETPERGSRTGVPKGEKKRKRAADEAHGACQARLVALKVAADDALLLGVEALYGLASADQSSAISSTTAGGAQ
jgi:hypothetical protein